MKGAGVTLMGTFAIIADLMRDWRNTPGAAEVLPFLDKYELFQLYEGVVVLCLLTPQQICSVLRVFGQSL